MRGWYIEAVDHAPPPSRITIKRITSERVELYHVIPTPPLGDNIPIYVKVAHIEEFVPMEEEVEWEMRILRGHRSGGPSRMRADHVQEWLQEHLASEDPAEAERLKAP